MAPASPLVIAQLELADAIQAVDTLRGNNVTLVDALVNTEAVLTAAEANMDDVNIDQDTRMEAYGDAYTAYHTARVAYNDVFGTAVYRITLARNALEALQV